MEKIERKSENVEKGLFYEEIESLRKYESENPYVARLISNRLRLLTTNPNLFFAGDYRN